MEINCHFYWGIGLGARKHEGDWFIVLPFVIITVE